ncbi:hypothetical protein BH09PSE6_BH09PSE6_03170 [soil metagenome]
MRLRLIESGVFRVEGDRVVVQANYPFNSPSMAAAALQGRHANGWIEWKDSNGRTLHELKRVAALPNESLLRD